MKTFRISAASLKSRWADCEHNLFHIEKAARRAAEDGSRLLLLPEASLTGAPWMDPKNRPAQGEGALSIQGTEMEKVQHIAKKTSLIIAVGLLEIQGGKVFITQALVDRTGIIGIYRKVHTKAGGSNDKTLFPVFQLSFARVGISICFDIMFPECARILALRGAEVFLAPFASLPRTRKAWRLQRLVALQSRAQDNRMFVVSSSAAHPHATGMPSEWGGSGICCAIDPLGRMIAESKGRSGTPQYVTALLEEHVQRTYFLSDSPPLRSRRPKAYKELTSQNLQEDYLKNAALYRGNRVENLGIVKRLSVVSAA